MKKLYILYFLLCAYADIQLVSKSSDTESADQSDNEQENFRLIRILTGFTHAQELSFDRQNTDPRIACWNNPISARNESINIFNSCSGILLQTIQSRGVNNVAFDPTNNRNLAVRFSDKTVMLFDLEVQNFYKIFTLAEQSSSGPIVYSKDGNMLAVGSQASQKRIDLIDLRVSSVSHHKRTLIHFYDLALYDTEMVFGIGNQGDNFSFEWQPVEPQRTHYNDQVGQDFVNARYAHNKAGSVYLKQMTNGTLELDIDHANELSVVRTFGEYDATSSVALSAKGNLIAYNAKNDDEYEVYILEQ